MDIDGWSLVLILGDAFCVDNTDFCVVPVECIVNTGVNQSGLDGFTL
jgi:hypothetical protein